jgi:hypothetical protein
MQHKDLERSRAWGRRHSVVVTDGKWDTACGRMLLMLTVTEDGDGFSGVGHLGGLNSLGSGSFLAQG